MDGWEISWTHWIKPSMHVKQKPDTFCETKSYENFPNVYKNFSIRIPWFNAIMSESK